MSGPLPHPRLTLDSYRGLVGGMPRPMPTQVEAFARHVCSAHSWYKQLPLLPPGVPFWFYLDPSAGMQRSVDSQGNLRVEPLEKPGFHHSSLPTRTYRERFGTLVFSSASHSTVSVVSRDGARTLPSDDAPVIVDPDAGLLYRIPQEVVEAGTALVSGLVHLYVPEFILALDMPAFPPNQWPIESGGATAYHAILDRCRTLQADPAATQPLSFEVSEAMGLRGLFDKDFTLHCLVEPERERQRRQMIAAMERVLALLD